MSREAAQTVQSTGICFFFMKRFVNELNNSSVTPSQTLSGYAIVMDQGVQRFDLGNGFGLLLTG